ncbi:uncharacterized protein LOC115102408 isoform X6 [Oncorhynchus nerka]|uniref:uncharacterized protein LOC115102408 isoform X6 n=1 Tax=Oncorhynchus nerka TaxID=8023 RepID=UPI00113215F9|nr:uncharacterized protein LOC115102408 isoform X4 [Oncorhynchus nerka]
MYKRCLHVNVGWAVYMMASLVLSESLVIQVDCNEDISMKCDAIEDKSYRSITWYKLNNRTGIIRRSDDEKPQFYEFPRPARFGMKDSLVLPRVRPEDAGNYLCLIRANIGQTNRESKVTLSVSTGCSKHQEETWQGQTTAVPVLALPCGGKSSWFGCCPSGCIGWTESTEHRGANADSPMT